MRINRGEVTRIIHGQVVTAYERKMIELNEACKKSISDGITVETSEGTEHFSLTAEDQINLQNLAFQVAAGAPGGLYHADGKLCRYFTADEINALVRIAISHVTYHTTYFNHLKAWVERVAADDYGKITYGAKLPKDLLKSMEALTKAVGGSQ